MFAKSKIVILTLLCATLINAQTVPEKKPTEAEETLRKDAIAFLRETLGDVNGMRSLENRISFTAELASLMWFHDEREARAMYVGVIGDFKSLLAKYDSQMNSLGAPEEGEPRGGGGFMSFGVEPTDRSRLMRRFSIAMGVRQQIAGSMAEHDADLAYSFYQDSLSVISNAELLAQNESRDKYFENQLLIQMAQKNAGGAAKYAVKSIEDGVQMHHVELLKKIYAKDAEKGSDFAGAILSKLKDNEKNEMGVYTIHSLVRFGEETIEDSKKRGGKRPIYSNAQLRELTEVLAQMILSGNNVENGMGLGYIDVIEKYQPGRAAQIRAKYKTVASSEAHYAANSGYPVISTGSSYANANSNSGAYAANSSSGSAADRERQEKADAEKKAMEDVEGLATKKLPKEERDRIVTQARKILMQTNSGRDKKIIGLGILATQVAKAGDKELATEIMRDAERLVNPTPKNYQDFMYSWLLASGFAQADPDRAFPLLEETIGRANDTLAAFVKVGEFIDVAEEMVVDGEVQVGAFGGQMVRGLTSELGMADTTIEVLAKADFVKTKNLTSRFDRPEIRVLAKMMVLRAVLSPKEIAKPDPSTSELPEAISGSEK